MGDAQLSTASSDASLHLKSKVALTVREKTMVYNVFNYILSEEAKKQEPYLFERPNKQECVEKTAKLLGFGVNTVYRILKDIKLNKTPTPPKKRGPTRNKSDTKTKNKSASKTQVKSNSKTKNKNDSQKNTKSDSKPINNSDSKIEIEVKIEPDTNNGTEYKPIVKIEYSTSGSDSELNNY